MLEQCAFGSREEMFLKQLREIVFKSLVDNLGVEPALLSRVQGNDPIVIELEGETIFMCIFRKKHYRPILRCP